MTPTRVAVVGVGHLGRHHARILAAIPEVELVAVADTRIEQARAVAEGLGTRAVGDYRELLDRIDAVSIAVPTSLHREVAGAFLERGIATMVEKPMAATPAEAEELVKLADARGCLLQVGHIERYNPALSALDAMPMRPKYIAAERLSTYTFRSTDIGVVLDLMIHDIDLVLSMTASAVRSVAAVGVSVFGGHEDVANARIEFEDGCVANLTASRASYQAVRKMRLWSAEGYATLDFASRQGTLVRPSDQLRLAQLDLSEIDFSTPASVKDQVFGKILRVDQVQGDPRDQLAMELVDFIHAARTGTKPRVDGEQALRAMRLAGLVLESLNAHQWEGTASGPVGPSQIPQPLSASPSVLRGPISWRSRNPRQSAAPSSDSLPTPTGP